MNIDKRTEAFAALGNYLKNMPADEFESIAVRAANENPWFTKDSVRKALDGLQHFLEKDALDKWAAGYPRPKHSLKVAIIMAGNLPLVGFHDLLCVLVSGHKAMVRHSSKDRMLPTLLIEKLCSLEPEFTNLIEEREQLKGFDAVIATGSDNSARYFDYYFGKYPHIIRKNRTSVAVLDGSESDKDLEDLGVDIFSYFGLGCRNVSKMFVPSGYQFDRFFRNVEKYKDVANHHKYVNNYDYQKSLLLINRHEFLDNGFLLLQENEKIVSPISVVYYEQYRNEENLVSRIEDSSEKIQVIVGRSHMASIPFGQSQSPRLCDYADNVDTMKFLTQL